MLAARVDEFARFPGHREDLPQVGGGYDWGNGSDFQVVGLDHAWFIPYWKVRCGLRETPGPRVDPWLAEVNLPARARKRPAFDHKKG